MKEENQIVPMEETYNIEPKDTVNFATKAANQLKAIVDQTKSKVTLNGQEHLKFEAWQTVAKFFGSTVSIEWTKPVYSSDEKDVSKQVIFGYEAKANVIDKDGRIISSAESGCFKDEPNWAKKPVFQIRSMAQTRACAKALRQVYSWVVVLAKFNPTPAEEMDGNSFSSESETGKRLEKTVKPVSNLVCQRCKEEINQKVYDYSMQQLGKPFCFNCQRLVKAELEKVPESERIKKVDSDSGEI